VPRDCHEIEIIAMRVAATIALGSAVPWQAPRAAVQMSCTPTDGVSRRIVLALLLPTIAPLPAWSETTSPLTPSAMLTAGQYLNDLRSARRGLDEVRPLLELNEDRGWEAARISIRKPPIALIRKACSKIIQLLPEGSIAAKAKAQIYATIKQDLEDFDNGCRPSDQVKSRPDVLALLGKLQTDLDDFSSGLGIQAAEPTPPPAPPPEPIPLE